MARNGSGTYTRVAGTPYVYNTVISETTVNAEMDDIATALTNSIAKDGQTTPTANLPMGTFKLTGLGAGTTAGDSVRYEQVALLTANNTLSGANTFSGNNTLSGANTLSGNNTLSGDNTFTGANTFRNAAGIRSEQAATQDAIAVVGRAGGTGSYEVTITPTTLTADRTVTVPDASGTMALQETKLSSGTAVTAGGAASYIFSGIPSWAKRVTVMLDGVSFSGTANFRLQLGDSGGIETSGYAGASSFIYGTSAGTSALSSGFDGYGDSSAAGSRYGTLTLSKLNGNEWVCSGGFALTGAASIYTGNIFGSKTLTDALTQIMVTTSNGTDAYDAGIINIMYE